MGGKTKEQLLEELSEVQKMLEERTETQGQMIKRFQTLIANEQQSAAQPGRFSRVAIFPMTADDDKITHGVIVLMP